MLAHKLYGYVMIFGAQPDEVSGGQQFHISINGGLRWVHESCFIHNQSLPPTLNAFPHQFPIRFSGSDIAAGPLNQESVMQIYLYTDKDELANKEQLEGFEFRPHLNFLVRTEEEKAVRKRVSSSRLRQIKSSLKLGATIAEAACEEEVRAFFQILEELYKEKVKKPLPGIELFVNFYKTPSICKFFIIKYEDKVVGGILCPIFKNKVIYEWYVCGKDGAIKGLHPSVLATWAPIEYGFRNGYEYFDFMGAGKPDESYGVREFKARFGGEEVGFGRFYLVLNRSLYQVGRLALKVYQKISQRVIQ